MNLRMRCPEIIDGVRIKQITDNPDNVVNFSPPRLGWMYYVLEKLLIVSSDLVGLYKINYENQLLKLVCFLKTNYINETMNRHLPYNSTPNYASRLRGFFISHSFRTTFRYNPLLVISFFVNKNIFHIFSVLMIIFSKPL